MDCQSSLTDYGRCFSHRWYAPPEKVYAFIVSGQVQRGKQCIDPRWMTRRLPMTFFSIRDNTRLDVFPQRSSTALM